MIKKKKEASMIKRNDPVSRSPATADEQIDESSDVEKIDDDDDEEMENESDTSSNETSASTNRNSYLTAKKRFASTVLSNASKRKKKWQVKYPCHQSLSDFFLSWLLLRNLFIWLLYVCEKFLFDLFLLYSNFDE